jgi:hypothetical protein
MCSKLLNGTFLDVHALSLDRQQFVTQLAVSGGDDSPEGWPPVSSRLCQFQTVHASGMSMSVNINRISGCVSSPSHKLVETVIEEY